MFRPVFIKNDYFCELVVVQCCKFLIQDKIEMTIDTADVLNDVNSMNYKTQSNDDPGSASILCNSNQTAFDTDIDSFVSASECQSDLTANMAMGNVYPRQSKVTEVTEKSVELLNGDCGDKGGLNKIDDLQTDDTLSNASSIIHDGDDQFSDEIDMSENVVVQYQPIDSENASDVTSDSSDSELPPVMLISDPGVRVEIDNLVYTKQPAPSKNGALGLELDIKDDQDSLTQSDGDEFPIRGKLNDKTLQSVYIDLTNKISESTISDKDTNANNHTNALETTKPPIPEVDVVPKVNIYIKTLNNNPNDNHSVGEDIGKRVNPISSINVTSVAESVRIPQWSRNSDATSDDGTILLKENGVRNLARITANIADKQRSNSPVEIKRCVTPTSDDTTASDSTESASTLPIAEIIERENKLYHIKPTKDVALLNCSSDESDTESPAFSLLSEIPVYATPTGKPMMVKMDRTYSENLSPYHLKNNGDEHTASDETDYVALANSDDQANCYQPELPKKDNCGKLIIKRSQFDERHDNSKSNSIPTNLDKAGDLDYQYRPESVAANVGSSTKDYHPINMNQTVLVNNIASPSNCIQSADTLYSDRLTCHDPVNISYHMNDLNGECVDSGFVNGIKLIFVTVRHATFYNTNNVFHF